MFGRQYPLYYERKAVSLIIIVGQITDEIQLHRGKLG